MGMERLFLGDLKYDDELLGVLLLDVCLCGLLVLAAHCGWLAPRDNDDDGLLGENGQLGRLVGVRLVLGLLVHVGTLLLVTADGGLVIGRTVMVGVGMSGHYNGIPAGELMEEETGQNSFWAGSSLSDDGIEWNDRVMMMESVGESNFL